MRAAEEDSYRQTMRHYSARHRDQVPGALLQKCNALDLTLQQNTAVDSSLLVSISFCKGMTDAHCKGGGIWDLAACDHYRLVVT